MICRNKLHYGVASLTIKASKPSHVINKPLVHTCHTMQGHNTFLEINQSGGGIITTTVQSPTP